MEIIGPIVEIVKLTWDPIGRRIGYIKNLKRNLKELNKHKENLDAKMVDLEEKITREISKVATRECNQWLKDVKDIEHQMCVIQEEYKEDKKCLAGWCPNVCSKMKLGKHVEEIMKEITDLNIKRLTFEGRELTDAPLEKVQPQNIESNSLAATEHTLKEILMFMEDDNTKMIGIWGMGGVGKTTTMKLLNDRLEGSLAFEIVLWVTVSRYGSRRKVQNAIAERLKLTVSESSDDQLKASIFNWLRRKKFLLLLDDVWEMINLSDVGIPALNQVDGCKVVLTTRSLKVCRQMKTNKDVKVETLLEDEAWNLFIKSAGDVALTSDIKQCAEGIVKECGGLPLAINVVGSSLRNNDEVVVWRHTLRELQSPTTSENEDMEEQVFRCLRSSYDLLQDDGKKKLFLYCSLYPEDHEIFINDLVEYCWLEGYIHGVRSIEDAREKGHYMVIGLIDTSLLERCRRKGYVKMHDIVRDFALREASGFLVKAGMNINHPLEEKEWLQMQKISLMKSNLCSLLERPNCRSLSTLLLQNNDQLTMIPDSLFECMHSLHIVDLSRTEIKSLPSSLWNLVNLRGLYLKDCVKLEELPSQVGALKQLEVLHLGGSTAIRYLPREVGELTCLKRLIVGFKKRYCSQNDGEDTKEWNMKLRVPTGIIPKLPYLEELSFYVRECVEKEQWDDESMEVVVEELCRLERLTYLDAYFPKAECLEQFLHHSESVKEPSWFRRFRFRVGTWIRDRSYVYSSYQECDRCLLYNGGLGTSHTAIMKTLAHCSFFHLQDHCTARTLSELGLANMNGLKICWVMGCDKMETLFDGDEQHETCALLPNLEELQIGNLPKLRSLCDGPLLPGSLSKLRYLELRDCKNLKISGIIRQLCSLELLWVEDCSNMEEIIEIEEEEDEMFVASHSHNVTSYNNDRVILPSIKKILLSSIPELVRICRGFSNFEWPSLDTIAIRDCPKLKSLSFLSNGTNIVAPALRKIYGPSRSWWEALEWEDNDIKQRLQPFLRILPYQ